MIFQMLIKELLKAVVERTSGFLTVVNFYPEMKQRVYANPEMRMTDNIRLLIETNNGIPDKCNDKGLEMLILMMTLVQAENAEMKRSVEVNEGLRQAFLDYGKTLETTISALSEFPEQP